MSKPFAKLSLVERLETIVSSGRHWDAASDAMLQAAQEIERLREQLAECNIQINEYAAQLFDEDLD